MLERKRQLLRNTYPSAGSLSPCLQEQIALPSPHLTTQRNTWGSHCCLTWHVAPSLSTPKAGLALTQEKQKHGLLFHPCPLTPLCRNPSKQFQSRASCSPALPHPKHSEARQLGRNTLPCRGHATVKCHATLSDPWEWSLWGASAARRTRWKSLPKTQPSEQRQAATYPTLFLPLKGIRFICCLTNRSLQTPHKEQGEEWYSTEGNLASGKKQGHIIRNNLQEGFMLVSANPGLQSTKPPHDLRW